MSAGRVVVVEDDDGMRQALVRLLQAHGHEAASFATAEALLESDARLRAACLILDIRLPGLSGFELRDRLTVEGAPPAVIYITAHDDERTRARAARESAPLFTKPVDGKQLLAAVGRALGEH